MWVENKEAAKINVLLFLATTAFKVCYLMLTKVELFLSLALHLAQPLVCLTQHF